MMYEYIKQNIFLSTVTGIFLDTYISIHCNCKHHCVLMDGNCSIGIIVYLSQPEHDWALQTQKTTCLKIADQIFTNY